MAIKHRNKSLMIKRKTRKRNFISGVFKVSGKIISAVCVAGMLVTINLPLFSAFEAHIINVTAEIVNDVPSIDPPSGEFCNDGSLEVALSAALVDADIIYTTDGSDPDCFIPNGAVYAGTPFPLTYSATIKARVCHYRDSELLQSAIMSEYFDVSATYCEGEDGQCDALSMGYWKNHEGCPISSNWTDEINALSSGEFSGAFRSISGEDICYYLAPSNYPGGGTVEGQLYRAKGKALADLSNIVSGHLNINAIIFGADDGNSAFDNLGLTPFSTAREALIAIENIIINPSATRDELVDAAYVAERIYAFYEEENPGHPECVYSEDNNIVLNEFLPNPCGDDGALMPKGEWVELYNNSGVDIDVVGWYLYDSRNDHPLKIALENSDNDDDTSDAGETVVPAKGWLVVYSTYKVGWLNNDTDEVRLYDGPIGTGNLIGYYNYNGADFDSLTPTPGEINIDDSAGTGGSSIPENKSFARIPDGIGEWADPVPTPGAPNMLEEYSVVSNNSTSDTVYNPPVTEPLIEESVVESPVENNSITEESNEEPPAGEPAIKPLVENLTEEPAVEKESPFEELSVEKDPILEESADEEELGTEPLIEEISLEEPVIEEVAAEEFPDEESPNEEILIEKPIYEELINKEEPNIEPIFEEIPPKESPVEELPVPDPPAEELVE